MMRMRAFVFDWRLVENDSNTVIYAYCISDDKPDSAGQLDSAGRQRWDIVGYQPYCYVEVENKVLIMKLLDKSIQRRYEPVDAPSSSYLAGTKRYAKVFFDSIPDMRRFAAGASRMGIRTHMDELDPLSVFLSTHNLHRTGWLEGEPNEHGVFTVSKLRYSEEPRYPHARIASIDIECNSSKGGMPRGYIPEDVIEIISIVCRPETYLLYLKGPNRTVNIEGCHVIACDTESELIEQTFHALQSLDPDIITGFNVFGFDFKYILSRLQLRLEPLPDISRDASKTYLKKIEWESSAYGSNDYYRLDCNGRVSFDAYLFFRRFKLERSSLQYISERYLGEGKDAMSIRRMMNAFETGTDFTEVARYCIKDADLVLGLIDKFSIWQELCETARAMDCAIGDIYTRGEQVKVVNQITRECILRKIVLVERETSAKHRYQGAKVIEPIPGIYSPCTILDFQSLYPSIMIAFNICPSTYVGEKGRVQFYMIQSEGGQECQFSKVVTQAGVHWIPIHDSEDSSGDRAYGYKASASQVGLLPGLAQKLIRLRKEVKKAMAVASISPDTRLILDKRQNALKIVANSLYGAMGAKESRYLYHVHSAESVTSVGRMLLGSVSSFIHGTYQVNVQYGDTDSCMLQAEPNLCKQIAEDITSRLPSPISLNFEAYYDRILLIAKKMYVLYRENGDVIRYKGVMNARRGFCAYAKEVYGAVVRTIMRTGSFSQACLTLEQELSKLRSGEVPMEGLVMTKSVKALDSYKVILPHVAMALRLRSKGVPIEPGTRTEYAYSIPTPDKQGSQPYLPNEKELTELAKRTVALDEWDAGMNKVDYRYYIDKQIRNDVSRLMKAAGWESQWKVKEQRVLG